MQKGQKIEDKDAGSWGSGLLGAQMETHNSLITSFFTSLLLLCFFSLLFKT
jgi:hypothetical protein